MWRTRIHRAVYIGRPPVTEHPDRSRSVAPARRLLSRTVAASGRLRHRAGMTVPSAATIAHPDRSRSAAPARRLPSKTVAVSGRLRHRAGMTVPSAATIAHPDRSRNAAPARLPLSKIVEASGHSRPQTRTTAPLAQTAVHRGQSRNVEQVRRLPLRIAAPSVRSILHREMKRRVVERVAAAAGIGIGPLPVRAGSSAVTPMATGEDRHGRSSICVSQSCGAPRTAEADIRAEANPATADRARHRVMRGRVMAEAVALGQHLAAEATSVAEAAEVTRAVAVEAEVTRAVAVIPEVVDIPATTKRVDRKLT
jgi:hypothetical protein